MWWHIPVILEVGKVRQDNCSRFEASLNYIQQIHSNNKKQYLSAGLYINIPFHFSLIFHLHKKWDCLTARIKCIFNLRWYCVKLFPKWLGPLLFHPQQHIKPCVLTLRPVLGAGSLPDTVAQVVHSDGLLWSVICIALKMNGEQFSMCFLAFIYPSDIFKYFVQIFIKYFYY